ncbi:MAG: YtxH domain-containing protein [Chloroflexota bacterium]|nr:YtxH domain-containing protein [Chloroflexota bacterium]
MRKFWNLLFGALMGGFVGSSLALLFAPASGEKLRGDITSYFENLQYEVNRAGEEKRAELEAQLKKLRSGEIVTLEENEA